MLVLYFLDSCVVTMKTILVSDVYYWSLGVAYITMYYWTVLGH